MLVILILFIIFQNSETFKSSVSFRSLNKQFILNAVEIDTSNKLLENPREFGLALELDDGTRKSHSIAENTQFVSGFFKGLSNRKAFSSLVESLYYIYEAMEIVLDETNNEAVKAIDYPELRRIKALESDMIFYFGENWREKSRPSMATMKYVNRIKTIGKDYPVLMVAHQYTRYLGDLFGGQMMGGMATRTLNVKNDEGIAFYKFNQINNVKEFINEFYKDLNQLGLEEDVRQAIVDEANLVFKYNIEIFEELEGNAISSIFRLLKSALKSKLGFGVDHSEDKSNSD